MNHDWPTAALTPVARARAMAAGLPGAGYREAVFDVGFDRAWARIADLERSVPFADSSVRRLAVRSRVALPDGAEQLRLTAWNALRLPQPFVARMEEGFCLMQARGRLFTVVMAAAPEPGGGTRYCHLEVVPRWFGRPLGRLMARMVRGDVEGFGRYVAG